MSNSPNFEMKWPKGQSIFYDQLLLGCEEKNLGGGLATPCPVLFQQGHRKVVQLVEHLSTLADVCT